MSVVDTQILIDGLLGDSSYEVAGVSISSVTANEFLGMHSDSPTKANYYIPQIPRGLTSLLHSEVGSRLHPKRRHPFNRMRTDRLVVDFGNDFPSLIEYGSIAISETINEKALSFFMDAISFLHKEHRKKLRRKFTFLLQNGISCIPVTPETVTVAQGMLFSFIREHQLKENFRNSWNDFLVAATALRAEDALITKDTLLFRYTASMFASLSATANERLRISFGAVDAARYQRRLESKGFINRAWDVKVQRGY